MEGKSDEIGKAGLHFWHKFPENEDIEQWSYCMLAALDNYYVVINDNLVSMEILQSS